MPNPWIAFFFFWRYYNCNFTDTGTKRLVKAFFRAEAVCQCRSYLLGSLTGRCAETWSSGLSAGFPYAVVLLSAECTSLCEKLSTVQIGLGDGMWVRFLKFAASLPTHEPLKKKYFSVGDEFKVLRLLSTHLPCWFFKSQHHGPPERQQINKFIGNAGWLWNLLCVCSATCWKGTCQESWVAGKSCCVDLVPLSGSHNWAEETQIPES